MAHQKSFPLHEAAREGKILTVKGLISESPKAVLEKDLDGRIPLHWAVSVSDAEITSILLHPNKFTADGTPKLSFDIDDYTDDAGWTALHIAASIGDEGIVSQLLEHEPAPDVDMKTSIGVTCAHLASSKKHIDVLKLLVSKGASLTIKDKKGQQPLHRAASVGSTGIVTFLIERKVPLNVKDASGFTPLHHALAEGFGDVAVMLVKAGADDSVEDGDGKTPLQVAVDDTVRKYFTKQLELL